MSLSLLFLFVGKTPLNNILLVETPKCKFDSLLSQNCLDLAIREFFANTSYFVRWSPDGSRGLMAKPWRSISSHCVRDAGLAVPSAAPACRRGAVLWGLGPSLPFWQTGGGITYTSLPQRQKISLAFGFQPNAELFSKFVFYICLWRYIGAVIRSWHSCCIRGKRVRPWRCAEAVKIAASMPCEMLAGLKSRGDIKGVYLDGSKADQF
jgi:hypothetical protein